MGGGAMWFVVCIPKEDNEKGVQNRNEKNRPTIQFPPISNKTNHNNNVTVVHKQILRDTLAQLEIQDAVWCASPNDNYYQVYFGVESSDDTDMVLRLLTARGIGIDERSTIACMPCAIFYRSNDVKKALDNNDDEVFEDKKSKGFKNAQQKFLKSVTARLTVAQVVEGVRGQGELNFDFVALILLAGMIAALGLMDNSVVSIIAAMLVSPLMGPIMAITFGIIIHDMKLIKTGLRTELCGLVLCLLFGFCFGITMAYFGDETGGLAWGPNTWPNPEQTARGQWRSLWVGALVALPSGGGVAMAILGGNSACLVGVAISASLLPPSINCGTLWSLALMKVFKAAFQEPIQVLVENPRTKEMFNTTTYSAYLAHDGFKAYYFDNANMHKECAVMAINSFCLTLVNILCIIVAGSLFLKIKEIAPEKSLPDTDRFWKHDIKVAREYNRRNTTVGSSGDMAHTVLSEWATVAGIDPKMMQSDDPKARISQLQTLQDILMDAEDDEVFQTVTTKVSNLSGADPVRRLSRAVLPQLPKASAGDTVPPVGSGVGAYERRPSVLVGNMLQDYERRLSRFDNSCYINPEFSSTNSDPVIPNHLQNRRRSSVARAMNFSYWPGQSQTPQKLFAEGKEAGRGRLSTNRSVAPVREEEDVYSHI
ncbi:uncharacterized protein LOC111269159 [Varroa jacobsoni]|uniref:uncharacterized protein LOC111269159 n=1 Tax=Varroa jacobsoni TaxID=62625 RepID=UPI000BFAA971|nr:uncharacterized protein LOC111269159 [Varroa jacobsoni]XP_022704304.1 uncharacterized protein LOC111269159 [Varroa jacobsoni]